ncbi:MAG TPA: excinuclease ABC subunit UvrA, partial [Verrucomicrobiae bacterium]
RQFFDRMDKPRVDSIEGIPPAIAIEQRNAVKTTRSTVGTMTEICDYMKIVWPHVALLHCRRCGKPVRKDAPQHVWDTVHAGQGTSPGGDVLITFDLPLTEKLSLSDCLSLIAKQGYQRLLLDGEVVRLDEAPLKFRVQGSTSGLQAPWLTVVQDRVKPAPANRARFVEACEQAYHFGKGKLSIHAGAGAQLSRQKPLRFSNRLHCAECDIEYREPSAALFSFNHPVGACPTCRGFGRVISIDYSLALPDRSKTLAQGVVKPWQTGLGAECQSDLLRMCRHFDIPTDVPFDRLPKKWQDFVVEGEPDYGQDEEHEWPRAWYGIKGYFRWLESRAYKMHVRVLLSRYRAYTRCPDCLGQRFQPETLLYRLDAEAGARGGREGALNLADFYALPIRDAFKLMTDVSARLERKKNDPLRLAADEVRSRLSYLDGVGLGYLTLDRPTRSLSGGETERVNLTTCLGSRLVNALFVLDEPSVGLHARDTQRLVKILQQLRDAGNTVVVVEHEPSVMRAADQIIDLGPGHGATGGDVVFQGTFPDILRSEKSLTGQYLSGRARVEVPSPRPVERRDAGSGAGQLNVSRASDMALEEARLPYRAKRNLSPKLKLSHATCHNLNDLTVEIPLGRFVCVTGVSGSGKTTLVREVLLPLLVEKLKMPASNVKASERISTDPNGEDVEEGSESQDSHAAVLEGAELLTNVVLVDQSILGKTPRSNPAVYIGAFDYLRELFAESDLARRRGLNASAFSFNSSQGQCQRCRGAGFEKIEMQFLSDVFIRCPDCDGRRYRDHILQVRIASPSIALGKERRGLVPTNPAEEERNGLLSPGLSSRGGEGDRRAGGCTGRPHREHPVGVSLSIADLLESTVEEAIRFLAGFGESYPACKARQLLQYLVDVGLGYLKLGQPINTLSGGESQRLKLVRHLAESGLIGERNLSLPARPGSTLFLFDEPTTGLHFDDVNILLRVFQRLVDQGHSVLVIEHNLEVIKCADWVIDLGPDAGDQGGKIVAEGTPADLAACEQSHTGRALREVLGRRANDSSKTRAPNPTRKEERVC